MDFTDMIQTNQVVIKLSVSNVPVAQKFYTEKLGFKVVPDYTINKGGTYEKDSYIQLTNEGMEHKVALGLYKDIDEPLQPEDTGTAPTFIVKDIDSVRQYLLSEGVTVSDIVENTSDKGYIDRFAFFSDPDNNTLAIRQNMN